MGLAQKPERTDDDLDVDGANTEHGCGFPVNLLRNLCAGDTFSNMKANRLILVLIVPVALLAACNRESPKNVASSTNAVVFREAAVSVDVGTGWKRIDYNPGPPNCTPTLSSSNGTVGAMLFGKEDTMQAAITALHQMFVNHTNSVKDSWHQVEFATASGIAGRHTSYIETKIKDGNKTLRQVHDFMFQRKDGRLISVTYMGPVGDKAEAIQQKIESSLKWQ